MSYPAQDVILEYKNTGIDRYAVTFEYDDVNQVVVRAWDPLTNEYISPMVNGVDYVFDGPTTIVFTGTPPDQFVILRNTDISQSYGAKRFSKFAQGNAIRASDLNGNLELLRMAIQETQGSADDNNSDITDLENRMDQAEQDIDDLETDVDALKTGKVNSVSGTAPVVSSGGLDPVISMPAASSSQDGYMSKEDKAKLDAALDNGDGYIELTSEPELKTIIPLWADKGFKLPTETTAATYEKTGAIRYNTGTDRIEVYDSAWEGVAGGAEIQTTPPANASPGDLWWDSEEGRGYVYYDDGDSKQWVESNPSWNGSIPDGSVTPAKLSTGGPSWDTSGNLDVSGNATFNGEVQSKVTKSSNTSTFNDLGADFHEFRNLGDDFVVVADALGGTGGKQQAVILAQSQPADNVSYAYEVRNGNANSRMVIGINGDICLAPAGANASVEAERSVWIKPDGSANFDGSIEFGSVGFLAEGTTKQIAGDSADNIYGIFLGIEPGKAYSTGRNIFFYTNGGGGINSRLSATIRATDNSFICEGNIFKNATTPVLATDFAVLWLEPDNEDNYVTTTDVDEEGNTVQNRVYNGPTLDVKDRLLNLISRLDAIEADEIIDDSNSSALLQLVHNLSARLDLRDQQIADLTNRIQTLELN